MRVLGLLPLSDRVGFDEVDNDPVRACLSHHQVGSIDGLIVIRAQHCQEIPDPMVRSLLSIDPTHDPHVRRGDANQAHHRVMILMYDLHVEQLFPVIDRFPFGFTPFEDGARLNHPINVRHYKLQEHLDSLSDPFALPMVGSQKTQCPPILAGTLGK